MPGLICRARHAWPILLLLLFACEHNMGARVPPAVASTASFCATDFSCPPGQECVGGACAPVTQAALRNNEAAILIPEMVTGVR